MIQSPLRVSETFSGVLKGQSYFHYNTKIYLPFPLLFFHKFTVQISRSYMTWDGVTNPTTSMLLYISFFKISEF